jgi:3-hydroxyisobutyrate dehydrogenase
MHYRAAAAPIKEITEGIVLAQPGARPSPRSAFVDTIAAGYPADIYPRNFMAFTKAEPGKTRIGWIGTGVMGRWMCQHLMTKGYAATVYNRTRDKVKPLLEAGATYAETPQKVAERSDVVFAIVGFPRDVREVFLGPQGALAGSKPGTVLVDMTTSEPSLAREIHEAAKARGAGSVDAPVSGGDVGAKNATLSIMVGGDADAVEAVRPLLECMGKTIVHQGPAGAGQHTKMVNQVLIATNMIGVCEALLYGYKAGLDLKTVLQSVGGGAAASWSLNNLGPRIMDRNFEPGFFVEHFIKDMGIALDEARRMGLALPGLALANQLYIALQGQGFGRKGTQALYLALEALSGIKR